MSVVLGRRHRLLHVWALLARWNGGEQEIRQVHSRSLLDSQLLHQERSTTWSPIRKEGRASRISSRRNAGRDISWVFTTGSSVMLDSERP